MIQVFQKLLHAKGPSYSKTAWTMIFKGGKYRNQRNSLQSMNHSFVKSVSICLTACHPMHGSQTRWNARLLPVIVSCSVINIAAEVGTWVVLVRSRVNEIRSLHAITNNAVNVGGCPRSLMLEDSYAPPMYQQWLLHSFSAILGKFVRVKLTAVSHR